MNMTATIHGRDLASYTRYAPPPGRTYYNGIGANTRSMILTQDIEAKHGPLGTAVTRSTHGAEFKRNAAEAKTLDGLMEGVRKGKDDAVRGLLARYGISNGPPIMRDGSGKITDTTLSNLVHTAQGAATTEKEIFQVKNKQLEIRAYLDANAGVLHADDKNFLSEELTAYKDGEGYRRASLGESIRRLEHQNGLFFRIANEVVDLFVR
jgi:hypothetical protein